MNTTNLDIKINYNSSSQLFRAISENIKKHYQLYFMLVIPVAYIIIFNYIPMYGVQIAFREFRASRGIIGSQWIGMKYINKFVSSYQFSRVIRNTFVLSIYSLVAGFPIPIILAIALNNTKAMRFKKTVQMVTYAPYFISTVVMVGIIIQFFIAEIRHN
jgi:putative aldouronate transport system permease protein